MQRLASHTVGIARGDIDLFSDFANGGDMWTGHGSRERRSYVAFAEPFRLPPAVHVSLSLWDMDAGANVRADIAAENVTAKGFDVVFRTWSDTKVARVRMSWLAIGAANCDDDWDVE